MYRNISTSFSPTISQEISIQFFPQIISKMARLLSQTLIRTSSTTPINISVRILTQRHRSDKSNKAQLVEVDLESETDVEVFGIKRLEDVINSIIIKRSAPDWLPFIPGSSYYVPPRRRPNSIVDILGKLSNPLSEDENMSLQTKRGWPSSAYHIEGTTPTRPVPDDIEMTMKIMDGGEFETRPDDEEG